MCRDRFNAIWFEVDGLMAQLHGEQGPPSRAELGKAVSTALLSMRSGAAAGLVLRGEAGIGKSWALQHLAASAGRQGAEVLWASGDQLDEEPPLSSLARAVQLQLPAGDPSGPAWSGPVLIDALRQRCGEGPLVLVIDDAQWLGSAALAALPVVLAGLQGLPFLLAVAARHAPRVSALEPALARLVALGAPLVGIGALAPQEVPAFVRAATDAQPSPRLARRLAAAGGNPAYLLWLAESGEQAVGTLPPVHHLAGLSETAHEVLAVAAVLGHRVPVEAVAVMLGRPPGTLLGAVEELAEVGVLDADSGSLQFRHGVVREAVLRRVPLAVLAALHAQAFQLLLATAPPKPTGAVQLLRAGVPLQATMEESVLSTARHLVERDAVTTASLVQRSLSLEGPEHLQQLALAVDVLPLSGLYHQARALLCEQVRDGPAALELLRTPQTNLAAVAAWFIPHAAALAAIDLALAVDFEPEPHAYLLAARARVVVAEDGVVVAEEAMVLARRAAEGLRSPQVEAELASVQGTLEWARGRPLEAEQPFERTVLLDGAAAPVTARAAQLWLLWNHAHLGRLDEVLVTVEPLRHAAEGHEDFLHPHLLELQAVAHLELGQLAAAAAAAGPVLVGLQGASESLALRVRAVLVETAVRQARITEAMELVQPWLDLYADGRRPDHRTTRWAPVAIAAARWAPALLPLVQQVADDLADGLELLVFSPGRSVGLVRALLSHGDVDRAEQVVAAAARYAEQTPLPGPRGAALHSLSLLSRDVVLLTEAADVLRSDVRPLPLADALCDLVQAIDTPAPLALRALKEADAAYERAGADGSLDLLRRAGLGLQSSPPLRSRRPTVPSVLDRLTDPERRVAELVAGAFSNREVAQRLFLSPHTVDSHLRRIFAKLGIRSRVELANVVQEELAVADRAGKGVPEQR